MLVIMESGATPDQISGVERRIEELGYRPQIVVGDEVAVVAAIGVAHDDKSAARERLQELSGVADVLIIGAQYKMAAHRPQPVVTRVNGVTFGGGCLVRVIGGPCAVESEEQLLTTVCAAKEEGADMFRAGAFKPRSNPDGWQGLGEEGLKLLVKAREQTGLPFVTEIMSELHVQMFLDYGVNMFQVGTRNAQNFRLLEALAKKRVPVLLKRGFACTVTEWLLAAEYVLRGGTPVILCARGVRAFEDSPTRNFSDIDAVAALVHPEEGLTSLPVIFDPSHATGKRHLVPSLAKAALAAGAHGIMFDVHPDPSSAKVDGPQSLSIDGFRRLMPELIRLGVALDRPLAAAA